MAGYVPTQDDLRRLFDYDSALGVLIWRRRETKNNNWNHRCAGKVAGSIHKYGYRVIKLHGKAFMSHRLIWLFFKGNLPKQLDHIDGIRSGGFLDKLRPADHGVNGRNQKLHVTNTSGISGVTLEKGRWKAYIKVEGVQKHLGMFGDKASAAAVRKAAEVRYGYHENHGTIRQSYSS